MGVVKDLITTFLGERLIDVLKAGTNRITEEVCHIANNKILEYLTVEYERNSKTKTILHRSEPVELDKFYQALFLCKETERWGKSSSYSTSKISTEKIEKIFCKNNCITIIGTAGSGKSTLIKYLFVNAIKSNYKIPIKVELRYLNNYGGSLLSYIKDEIIKFSGIAESDRIIENLLDSGDFVVFFDGYDEVASNKKEAITQNISQITRKYFRNKYILTSRPFVNIEMLDNFHNYRVCDLSMEEIRSFVKKQFNISEQELADKIIETINNEDYSIYKSFLSNPLLLSMFIITYQTDSNIPQKRSDYYCQVFNTLYSVHDTSSKLGFLREKKSGLSKEQFVDILKRFSFKSFFSQNYTFTVEYFESQLQSIKKDLSLSFNNESIIYDLEVAIGILTQEGLDITYPHRSLQEYFAALFVSTLTHTNKLRVYDYLQIHFNNIFNKKIFQDDNLNFYFLLSEMDHICFQKQIIIPALNYVSQYVATLDTQESIISFFITLREISSLCSKKMRERFNDELIRYNNRYREYLNFELKMKNSSDDDATFRENAREKLALNDIKPFLLNYGYNSIIQDIESEIKTVEDIDSNFIDSLL